MEGSRLELGDGTCKIFINARSKRNDVPPKLKSLMDYLCGKEPCSNLTRYISDSIRKAKDNRRWERDYMYFEENLQEAKALGKEEGLTQGREEGLTQGREEMISAIRYLTDNGRTSEINRLAADPDFLTQILKEMGS